MRFTLNGNDVTPAPTKEARKAFIDTFFHPGTHYGRNIKRARVAFRAWKRGPVHLPSLARMIDIRVMKYQPY